MEKNNLVINTKDPSEYSERSFCFLNHMKNKYDFPHFLLLAATVISQLIVIIATAAQKQYYPQPGIISKTAIIAIATAA